MNLDHVHVLKVSSFYDQRGVCEFRLLRKRKVIVGILYL